MNFPTVSPSPAFSSFLCWWQCWFRKEISSAWRGIEISNDILALIIFWAGRRYRSARRLSGPPMEAGDHHRHPARSHCRQTPRLRRAHCPGSGARGSGMAGGSAGGPGIRRFGLAQHRGSGRICHQRQRTGQDENSIAGCVHFAAPDRNSPSPRFRAGPVTRCTWWCCFPSGRRSRISASSGAASTCESNRGAAPSYCSRSVRGAVR